MKNCPENYYVTVLEDTETNQVIGSATLVKELKFIHDASAVNIKIVIYSLVYPLTRFLVPASAP